MLNRMHVAKNILTDLSEIGCVRVLPKDKTRGSEAHGQNQMPSGLAAGPDAGRLFLPELPEAA